MKEELAFSRAHKDRTKALCVRLSQGAASWKGALRREEACLVPSPTEMRGEEDGLFPNKLGFIEARDVKEFLQIDHLLGKSLLNAAKNRQRKSRNDATYGDCSQKKIAFLNSAFNQLK